MIRVAIVKAVTPEVCTIGVGNAFLFSKVPVLGVDRLLTPDSLAVIV